MSGMTKEVTVAKNNNLHPNRHLILYTKGFYLYTTPKAGMAGLSRVIAADCPGETVGKVLAKVAAEALLKSDDPQAELESHINFLVQRFMVISEDQVPNQQDIMALKYEALMAIIARWKLPEDVELGDPDPAVWSLTSPLKEKR